MSDSRYQVDVSVVTRYLADQSNPEHERFAFAYTITVQNRGTLAARLLSRHWVITDGNGHIEHVRGPGVIGEQPHLSPGDHFEYTSACPLPTSIGTMEGTYEMVRDDGSTFDAVIGAFALADPDSLN